MKVKGNYEVRIALVDLITLDHYNEETKEKLFIDNNSDDETFYNVAEKIGTVFTLGGFTKCINNNYVEISGFDSYIRVFLVDLDNTEHRLVLLDNSLILKEVETTNEKFFKEYDY